jgi:hypothetical protein
MLTFVNEFLNSNKQQPDQRGDALILNRERVTWKPHFSKDDNQ